jgi:hypothetical protein
MFAPQATLSILALVGLGAAAPAGIHDHDHASMHRLPTRWYHEDSHPAHALFARDTPAVGSAGMSLCSFQSRASPDRRM